MTEQYASKIKFAWTPKRTFYGKIFIFSTYIEVEIVSSGIKLIDIYDDLGENPQANWMVEEYNKINS